MKSLSKTALLASSLAWFGKITFPASALAAGYALDSFRPSPMVSDVGNYFSGVINLVFVVAMALVLFYLIFGAVGWITSSGDTGKLQTAKNRMIQATIGLFVLSCVWALYIFFIQVTTGQDLINGGDIPIPTLGP